MQFYLYDAVIIKEGVRDSDSGLDLSGMSGRISNIGYRNDGWPITVDVTLEGGVAEYCFSAEELILVEEK